MSLQLAVAELRAGRWEQGRVLLEAQLAQPQPPTVEGPLRGLLAQALFQLGELEGAKTSLRLALRIAKALDDEQAVLQLRELNGHIYAALAQEQEQQRLAEQARAELARPLDEQLAGLEDPIERCNVLLRKADADEDLELAELALAEAAQAGPREQVLAHLCLARLKPPASEQHLRAAHRIADRAEEPQLVAAIAKAARAAGVDFATHVF